MPLALISDWRVAPPGGSTRASTYALTALCDGTVVPSAAPVLEIRSGLFDTSSIATPTPTPLRLKGPMLFRPDKLNWSVEMVTVPVDCSIAKYLPIFVLPRWSLVV